LVNESHSVRLTARNEGIEYVDDVDIYRFRVARIGRVWTLYLPCTKGPEFEVHELDEEEEARVLPRITKYLRTIWWFGFFPRRYTVVIERLKPRT
jgi:hypothetical protein